MPSLPKLKDLSGRALHWDQPKMIQREYRLTFDEQLLATMRFRSAFGSLATVESEEGSWSFKRVGFWRTSVTVRATGSEQDLGRFLNNTWSAGGTLELPDGRRYRANTNFWGSSYEFQDETGISLVSYRRISGLLHLSAFMEISAEGARLPELPWLASLGWYLAVKMHDDAAMAAAAAG